MTLGHLENSLGTAPLLKRKLSTNLPLELSS